MLDLLINNSTANTKIFQRFIADIPDDSLCTQLPGLPNLAALRESNPASLDVPHDLPQALPLFPTKLHLIYHLLTTHDGLHLGQLSDLRRTMGLPRIL